MKTRHEGLTLIELLITLAFMVIGAMIALPAYQSMLYQHTRAQNTNQLLGLIHFARYSAVTERATVTICPVLSRICQSTHNWSGELLAFIDHNRNGRVDANEPVLKHTRLPPDTTWRWWNFRRRSYLQFTDNGQPASLNGTLTLCQDGRKAQKIVINVLGRPRTETLSTDALCTE
jgi:type IV fimbrial biogenesis protein FimT